MSFVALNQEQINQKVGFIQEYILSSNAASGSKMDANANVTHKNIATLESELYKDFTIQINRHLMYKKITEIYGEDLAKNYLGDLNSHLIYKNDETRLTPYCASITLYPFLINGIKDLGGESGPPKNLNSFCGSFINLVFAVSAQLSGAVATVEFLMYFNYFAEKQFGLNYLKTNLDEIHQYFQQVVYTLNQPAMARGYQSVFWNISCYDQHYFNGLFENFIFPDQEGTKPNYHNVSKLQQIFLSWLNKERERAVLTFPVVTCAMLVKDGAPLDAEFEDMCSQQLSEHNSFFIYQSDSVDSLSSCCRLRNSIEDANQFCYTLGAGGVSTGSVGVITLNFNRLVQCGIDLDKQIIKIQKYLHAYRSIIKEYVDNKMLTIFDSHFITLDKLYVTIGLNGIAEAAEYLGYSVSNNDDYIQYVSSQFKIINDLNVSFRKQNNILINTELVPAENLGVKNSGWDKRDGLKVNRDCYNSYLYLVEDEEINMADKFVLHGKEIIQYLDGGSALHLNIDEALSKQGFKALIRLSAKTGCNYFCTNILTTICNDCNHIDKTTKKECCACGSHNLDYATRIIGYLKRISHWSNDRQLEHRLRFYHRKMLK